MTDARNDVITYQYDGLDRRIATVHPDLTPADLTDNPTERMFYDLRQNMTHRQDERGILVYQGYDIFNRLSHTSIETNLDWTDGNWVSDADLVHQEVTAFNAWSQALTILNNDRVPFNRVYDSFGLVRATSGTEQPTVQFAYTPLDRMIRRDLLAVADIPASFATYTYDNANGDLLVGAIDRAGNVSTTRYGVDYQVEETIAPINSDTVGTSNELPTTTIYDTLGRVVGTVDEVGARQAIEYDVLDRLTARFEADHPFEADGSIDALSEVGVQRTTYTQYSQVETLIGASVYPIRFSYDAEGNRLEMTDGKGSTATDTFGAGTVTRWDYDERDRVVRKRYDFQSATVFGDDYSYNYLSNNLLANMTDGEGNFIQYAYEDSRNLLLLIDYPTDEDIVYGTVQGDGTILTSYDKARRVTRFEDETGVCTMEYDLLGRMSRSVQGNVAYEQVSSYDEWSRPELMRCRPEGAADGDPLEWTCAYSYDVAGRLETMTDSQVSSQPFSYTYHPRATLVGTVATSQWLPNQKNLGRAQPPEQHQPRGQQWHHSQIT